MEAIRVTEEGEGLWESQAMGYIGWKRKRKKGGKRQREIQVYSNRKLRKRNKLKRKASKLIWGLQ